MIDAYPNVNKIEWKNNENNTIFSDSSKYSISWFNEESTLIIKNVDFNDFGIYTIVAFNEVITKHLQLKLKGIK